jgi:hypothetical protein
MDSGLATASRPGMTAEGPHWWLGLGRGAAGRVTTRQ